MKIESVSVKFPEKVLTLDETIEMIEIHSRNSFSGDLKKTLKLIRRLLLNTGARTRRWLTDEKPIDLIVDAVQETLQKANCDPQEVDLLIYTGVGRGFIEPGNSYLVAKAMGMDRVECFDILDACMSWTRALNICYHYLRSGQYGNILLVNGEFPNIEGGALYPVNYCLENIEEIEWTFPTFTVGNASTATLLTNDPDNEWEWHFRSRANLADLCSIPTSGYQSYAISSPILATNGENRFTSYGTLMHQKGSVEVIDLFQKLTIPKQKIKRIFPHASSQKDWDKYAEACGVKEAMFHVYPEYGNLVSASVPAGIALAQECQAIARGDRLVGWVGSAGMSFSAYSFVY